MRTKKYQLRISQKRRKEYIMEWRICPWICDQLQSR